jgi:hypothetical protein
MRLLVDLIVMVRVDAVRDQPQFGARGGKKSK